MPKTTFEKHYLVSVKCHETRNFPGEFITSDNTVFCCGTSDGYPSCQIDQERAMHFSEPPSIEEVAEWDGMPWYYRFKEGTGELHEITIIRTEPVVQRFTKPLEALDE